jgi:hypothetical protein
LTGLLALQSLRFGSPVPDSMNLALLLSWN